MPCEKLGGFSEQSPTCPLPFALNSDPALPQMVGQNPFPFKLLRLEAEISISFYLHGSSMVDNAQVK